jgi:hypothetical protein
MQFFNEFFKFNFFFYFLLTFLFSAFYFLLVDIAQEKLRLFRQSSQQADIIQPSYGQKPL